MLSGRLQAEEGEDTPHESLRGRWGAWDSVSHTRSNGSIKRGERDQERHTSRHKNTLRDVEYSTGNTVTSIVATAYGDSWVLGFSAESLCMSYKCLITMCAPETNTAYQLKLENKF